MCKFNSRLHLSVSVNLDIFSVFSSSKNYFKILKVLVKSFKTFIETRISKLFEILVVIVS